MIDIIIVCAYLAILLYVGILNRSKNATFKDFAKIRDKTKTNRLILVTTIFASSIGGGTTFGISEKVFAENLAYSYGLLLAIPIDLLIASYIVPQLAKHHGVETAGDIMYVYYGKIGKCITGIAAVLVSLGLVAVQISVSGRIFEFILQINYVYGIIISYGIVVIYSTIGGLRSILFTNQLQFFAIIFAIPIITIYGIHDMGVDYFIQTLPYQKISIVRNSSLLTDSIAAFLGFCCMNLFPNFIQRATINSNPMATKQAIYIKSLILAIFVVCVTINGILAYMNFADSQPALALPKLIDYMIPIGIQGIVIVGLLAAVMSTADSDLNITAISLVKDIIIPTCTKNVPCKNNQHKMLKIARIANIVLGIAAIICALCFHSVVDLVVFISGSWGPVVLIPMVFALLGYQIPERIMVIASILGLTSFILWQVYYSSFVPLKGVFIGTMVNFLVVVIYLLLSKVNYLKTAL